MRTLGDIIRKGARIHRDREALVFEDTRLTFGALEERVNRLANFLLRSGLPKGSGIGILAENTHKYIEVYLGAAKAGMVVTPLNFRLSDDELLHIASDAEISCLFLGEGFERFFESYWNRLSSIRTWVALDSASTEMIGYEGALSAESGADPEVEVDENALAILMYTGGTTGLPKGVMLSHRNLVTALMCMVQQYQFTHSDTTCMLLPLFHVSFWPAFCHLMVGGRTAIVRRPELPLILRAIQDEKCTHVTAVPTLYNWMLDFPGVDDFDLSSLRLMVYAGSPIPDEVLRKCLAKFGNVLAQGYGLTEAAPVVSALMPEDHALEGPKAKLLQSVGKEMLVVEVKIADEEGKAVPAGTPGEVLVRGPNIMMGYWKNPELTAEKLKDGWLHTGDVGMLDSEGYLYLVDRKADMIITGGENVYPSETEGTLYKHPAVYECVVASAPDDKWGERVQAVVVLRKGMQAGENELIEFCKARLAGYKCPKKVLFWESIPKSQVGKILRKDVKAKFWDGSKKPIG